MMLSTASCSTLMQDTIIVMSTADLAIYYTMLIGKNVLPTPLKYTLQGIIKAPGE